MVFADAAGFFVLFSILFVIAWEDCKSRRISNRKIIILFAVRWLFLVPACIQAGGTGRAMSCAAGFFMGGVVFLLCYLFVRGGVGAGDVKLFAVLGWWLGSERIFPVIFLSASLAVCRQLVLSLMRGKWVREGIPLAPFAWLGAIGVIIWEIQGG